jgi:hypothetical protein
MTYPPGSRPCPTTRPHGEALAEGHQQPGDPGCPVFLRKATEGSALFCQAQPVSLSAVTRRSPPPGRCPDLQVLARAVTVACLLFFSGERGDRRRSASPPCPAETQGNPDRSAGSSGAATAADPLDRLEGKRRATCSSASSRGRHGPSLCFSCNNERPPAMPGLLVVGADDIFPSGQTPGSTPPCSWPRTRLAASTPIRVETIFVVSGARCCRRPARHNR